MLLGQQVLNQDIRKANYINYVLYPELLTYQNHIYRNGEIFFSREDYNNKSLSAIEQFILQSLGKYRVSVDLEYINEIS